MRARVCAGGFGFGRGGVVMVNERRLKCPRCHKRFPIPEWWGSPNQKPHCVCGTCDETSPVSQWCIVGTIPEVGEAYHPFDLEWMSEELRRYEARRDWADEEHWWPGY